MTSETEKIENIIKNISKTEIKTLAQIKELNKEVKLLRNEVSKGKGAVSVLVLLGTIAASIIGFLQFK